jgi:hypothetical protein
MVRLSLQWVSRTSASENSTDMMTAKTVTAVLIALLANVDRSDMAVGTFQYHSEVQCGVRLI